MNQKIKSLEDLLTQPIKTLRLDTESSSKEDLVINVAKGPGELEFSHDEFSRGPLMKKKMIVKALSESIERFDAQLNALKCRLKAKKASLKVENLFQNLRI
ncbi:unnamed protein product [Brassica rapa]|uniref:Uncharacterized protein n=2 Tax=Brassica campestris TaxID=3711 RepID=A0A8D9HZK6_BRACM|nr:unnamed protein product [Brassica rapa]